MRLVGDAPRRGRAGLRGPGVGVPFRAFSNGRAHRAFRPGWPCLALARAPGHARQSQAEPGPSRVVESSGVETGRSGRRRGGIQRSPICMVIIEPLSEGKHSYKKSWEVTTALANNFLSGLLVVYTTCIFSYSRDQATGKSYLGFKFRIPEV